MTLICSWDKDHIPSVIFSQSLQLSVLHWGLRFLIHDFWGHLQARAFFSPIFYYEKFQMSQVRWCTAAILAHRRQRQAELWEQEASLVSTAKFQASQIYIVRPCLKTRQGDSQGGSAGKHACCVPSFAFCGCDTIPWSKATVKEKADLTDSATSPSFAEGSQMICSSPLGLDNVFCNRKPKWALPLASYFLNLNTAAGKVTNTGGCLWVASIPSQPHQWDGGSHPWHADSCAVSISSR